MAKLILSDLANLQNEATAVSTLAANNALVETALENTLSRDGTSPNTMTASLDMNSQTIINLPSPTLGSEPVTKTYGDAHYGDSLASATAAAASAAAALVSETAASVSETNAGTSETNASTSETNAATSASNAATSETNAATSATSAANSAGVIGAKWNFEASTTMAAPAVGGLRFNNATVASVTSIAVNAQDAESGNPDISNYIITWDDSTNTAKGYMVLRKFGTPATFAIFTVTAVTDNTTWLQIDGTVAANSGTWSAADVMVGGFTRAGDKGADGAMTGPGVSVDSEIALYDGITGTSLKRASTTGILKATSGVLTAASAGTDYYNPGGTDVAVADGGTGSSTASGALTNLTARGQGKETVWIPALAMISATTNGPSTGTVEQTTNKNMTKTLDFDTTTSEIAQFFIAFPKSWDLGTVTFTPYWTAASGSGTVIWALSAVAVSNDDPLDVAFGTAQSSTDTLLLAYDNHVGPESSAITIAGTPAVDDIVNFKLVRDVSDTLDVDAKLLGVKVFFTTNAVTDA